MDSTLQEEPWILPFLGIGMQDVHRVGGKNASLGEMITNLQGLGLQVPSGFATTAKAYYAFLEQNGLMRLIDQALSGLDPHHLDELKVAGESIREAILKKDLPQALVKAVHQAYQDLGVSSSQTVAVRSSATAEDLPDASFAGQQESFLNIRGVDDVLLAIKRVYASLFTDRAISYRIEMGFDYRKIGISAGVQLMVRSDLACSGVAFTLDTETGFDQVIFITAAYGLGECIVQGEVNPDEFYVHKPTLRKNKASIISRKLGSKQQKMIYAEKDQEGNCTERVSVPEEKQVVFCMSDEDILSLSKMALIIEDHYQKPMDIEWAKDGLTNEIFIIQARPETVESRKSRTVLENYQLEEVGEVLVTGRSVGQKIGSGIARIIMSPKDMSRMKKGDILVTDMTDPDWEPIMKLASAIVTNRGGRTCHAAIIARELGIPAVVGCERATERITEGADITVSCSEGETGKVYKGKLNFMVTVTDITDLPKLPVKLCMNLANPEQAFLYQSIPNEGVGLARLEFIIGNRIGIHPNALLHFEELPQEVQAEIRKKISAYESPCEFYTEKLAEGIAMIAAAFFPKPIIVRFSDFKSNEYANLIGGKEFEPYEENPMIGFRGASRYVSPHFQACFAMECEAIKRVREKKGLTNTHIMLPFVRTVAELEGLIVALKKNHLERGKDGLKLFMMCEIPSNALLADEFLKYVDGFSIGSNDLTQLTLGLDRDSSLVAGLFDERNDAVKLLLKRAIDACNKENKYIGICGQGPSDHPDFAAWLMKQGIQSISLTPDSVVSTWLMLSKIEKPTSPIYSDN